MMLVAWVASRVTTKILGRRYFFELLKIIGHGHDSALIKLSKVLVERLRIRTLARAINLNHNHLINSLIDQAMLVVPTNAASSKSKYSHFL